MIWKNPHISKIYEALTVIADSRIELDGVNKAKCFSSSRNKFYEIEYTLDLNRMMSNDNTAFYTDSLSYPMIAILMLKGKLNYERKLLKLLKGIYWKDINQKFNNDYDKTIEFVLSGLADREIDVNFIRVEVQKIYKDVCKLKISMLGNKQKPPVGY